MVMSSLRLGVRAAAWMVGDLVPWQLLRALRSRDLDARITRAQAAFDAFEEEHETWPGEPDGLDEAMAYKPAHLDVEADFTVTSAELLCPNCKTVVIESPIPNMTWSGHCPGCGGWLQIGSRTLIKDGVGGYFPITLQSSATAAAGVDASPIPPGDERGGEVSAPNPPSVAPSPPPSTSEYVPLFIERRCEHCDYYRGQHLCYGDPNKDTDMHCPKSTTFKAVIGTSRCEEYRS